MLDYSISIDLPPGSIKNLQAVDTLDSGLAFVGCDLAAPVSSGTLVLGKNPCSDPGALTVRAVPASDTDPKSENAGRHINFNFGRVRNPDAGWQTLVVNYRVIVLNISGNHNGAKGLKNNVKWSWEGGTLSGAAAGVNIIEPQLALEKSVSPTVAAQGSVVTFTLKVEHAPGSTAPAYEALVIDPIPAGLALDENSVVVDGSSGLPAPKITMDSKQVNVYWSEFPLEETATITFKAKFIGPPPVTNTASVEWSSILIDPATHLQPLSPHNQHATERRYDPKDSSLNRYHAVSSATLTAPHLPLTGFAPGQVSRLPGQPVKKQYQELGNLWLEIPRLNVRAPIVGVPLNGEDWDLTWLGDQAGYLNGTAYPTHAGNSFITAHVYTPDGRPGVFASLQTLQWGDQIRIHLDDQIYIYQIQSVMTVSPGDHSIFKHEELPWLTLITCKDYDPITRSYIHRVAVRAVLLQVLEDTTSTSGT
jgi:LPXTG-site transpeptidase (sortase) family protein